ncbi:MAG: SDR family NAD(P)-dependent oxidoreductase [Rhodobacteraceae bacterium]|nr:SDR family NAD(P)-dependent oxidoreductase [Paracoccaceae bacterium]
MNALNGKTAWITGGGSGIGAGAAIQLAEAGAEVIVSGRRAEPLQSVVDTILAAGGQARALPLDVAEKAAVADAAAAIGPVDILLANAGLNVPARGMGVLNTDDWDRVVNVNLNGVFYPVHAVLPGMRTRGAGTLILIASWAGRYPGKLTGPAYSTTKRAVIALSESINGEEGGNGIRSTVIMPGEVATDILKSRPRPPSALDQARMLQVDDLARTVRFVAEMPQHVCLNEILIAPTWNRFYMGIDELD